MRVNISERDLRKGFELTPIVDQCFFATVGERLSEGRCGAEFAVGDAGEGEPVVPVAARLLERLEGAGEATG